MGVAIAPQTIRTLSLETLTNNDDCRIFIQQTKFDTAEDNTLEKFYLNALRWLYAVANRQTIKPCWFTVCGRSGIGKTMLATALFNYCLRNFKSISKDTGDRVSLFEFYKIGAATLADTFRIAGYNGYAEQADLLFIDDIGAEKDTTGYAKGKLCELLCRRVNKWTIITSNLTLTELGERYDARISSRIIRGENIFVPLYWKDKETGEIEYVKDYAMRKYP